MSGSALGTELAATIFEGDGQARTARDAAFVMRSKLPKLRRRRIAAFRFRRAREFSALVR